MQEKVIFKKLPYMSPPITISLSDLILVLYLSKRLRHEIKADVFQGTLLQKQDPG